MEYNALLQKGHYSDYEEEEESYSLCDSLKVPVLSVAYCTVSIGAVFLNKILLSRSGAFQEFKSVEFLMLMQSIIGVLVLLGVRRCRVICFPIAIDRDRIMRIALVNILFVLMTCANAYSVKQLSLPMVALLKNSQVVVICFLEYVFLKNRPGKLTISALSVIVFSSFCGTMTDLEFNAVGYIWMAVAVFSSSFYYIAIKFVFKECHVPEFTLVFYNNVLSIPCFIVSAVSSGLFTHAFKYTLNGSWLFWTLVLLSGFAGIGVNITTYLFVAAASPTSFSVLGFVKKITQTLLGYLTWKSPVNTGNIVSVCVGVLGGITYTIAKTIEKDRRR